MSHVFVPLGLALYCFFVFFQGYPKKKNAVKGASLGSVGPLLSRSTSSLPKVRVRMNGPVLQILEAWLLWPLPGDTQSPSTKTDHSK